MSNNLKDFIFQKITYDKKDNTYTANYVRNGNLFTSFEGDVDSFDDIIFDATLEAVTNICQDGDTLVLISNNPQAAVVYDLTHSSDVRWAQMLDIIKNKRLSIGNQKVDEPSFRTPVNYHGDAIVDRIQTVLDSAEDVRIVMEDLVGTTGQLMGDGTFLIKNTDEFDLTKIKGKIDLVLIPSDEPGDRETETTVKIKTYLVFVADSRLLRAYDTVKDTSVRQAPIILKNGTIINLPNEVSVSVLIDPNTGERNPIRIFSAVAQPLLSEDYDEPKNKLEWLKHRKSVTIYETGLSMHGETYVYFCSSTAAMRQNSAMFIRQSCTVPRKLLELFKSEAQIAYINSELFQSFNEIEKMWDILTYGAYGISYGKDAVISKKASRIGLMCSSTKGFTGLRTRCIGSVIVPWSEYIRSENEKVFRDIYGFEGEQLEENLAILEKNWKKFAVDGCSFMRASAGVKIANASEYRPTCGGKWTEENIVGKGIPSRYALFKGVVWILPDYLFNQMSYINSLGEIVYPYKDYDLILEQQSVKEEWNPKVFSDALGPVFEMIGITREDVAHTIDSQFVNSLEFNSDTDANVLKDIINENCNEVTAIINDINLARSTNNIIARSNWTDSLTAVYETEDKSLDEGYLRLIDQDSGPVKEPYVRKRLIAKRFGESERGEYGKLRTDADRLIMCPDLATFFLGQVVETDRIDFLSGEVIFDIMITRSEQTSIPLPGKAWCGGRTGRIATYRNPLCVSGEIAQLEAMGIDEITDADFAFIYEQMSGIIVFSVFSFFANAMGGGDYDGDSCVVVWLLKLIKLIKKMNVVLVDLASKSVKKPVCYENIKSGVGSSLCSDGIGLITNCGMSWIELGHIMKWEYLMENSIVHMPKVWVLNKSDDPTADEFIQVSLKETFFSTGKYTRGKALLAKDLVGNTSIVMPEWERKACQAIADLATQRNSYLLSKESLTWAEFEELYPIFMAAVDGATKVIRFLQELAIETPKSDVWALYTRVGKDLVKSDRYDYAMIRIRPFWKKHAIDKNVFQSDNTPMGVVSSYSRTRFDTMQKKLLLESEPIAELMIDKAIQNNPISIEMDKLVVEYNEFNSKVAKLREGASERQNKIIDSEVKNNINRIISLVNPMLLKYGISPVLKAAYTSTYKYANKAEGVRMGFVYAILKEEFLAYINNSSTKDQTVLIPVKSFGYIMLEGTYDAEYHNDIKQTILSVDGIEGAMVKCAPCNGKLDVIIVNDKPYVKALVPRVEKTVRNKNLGREISIIDLKAHGHNEKTVMQNMRAKCGRLAMEQAFDIKLTDTQDIITLNETVVDCKGVDSHCIVVNLGKEEIGIVAPANVPYIRELLAHGNTVIVEFYKKIDGFSKSSIKIKVLDVICK